MSKSIVCKFKCSEVRKFENGEGAKLLAVSGKENEPWSKWTPSGAFEVSITNPDAFGAFEVGKEYLLHVSPVEPAPAAG